MGTASGGNEGAWQRRHGMERPFDGHQVGAWVAFAIILVLFYVLYPPLCSSVSSAQYNHYYCDVSVAIVPGWLWS